MNGFDKFCAVLAYAIAIVCLIGGFFGTFAGIKAWFSLPSVVGILPALIGWGIIRSVHFAWRVPRASSTAAPTGPYRPQLDLPESQFGDSNYY